MKKILVVFSFVFTIGAFQSASADTLAQWTFESLAISPANTNSPSDGGIHGIAADVGTGTTSGLHSSPVTGQFSTPVGDGSTKSLSSSRWSVGDYYQFSLSTIGFSGLSVYYEQTSSATGPRDFNFSYSLDGTTFTQVGANYIVLSNSVSANNQSSGFATTAWSSASEQTAFGLSFDLSSILALNNAPNVYFRITDASTTSDNGGTVATAGTDRVDNFIVSVVPEPTSIALAALGGFSILGMSIFRKRK